MADCALRSSWTGILLAACCPVAACSAAAYGGPPTDSHASELARMAEELGFPNGYDEPPKPERITKPIYPKPAFAACIEGTVVVLIGIDASGTVSAARIAESVEGLDAAALACVKTWRFKSAKKAGVPIESVALAPVLFRIYDDKRGNSPPRCEGKTRAPLQ
jgi:TonB family protein